MILIVRTPKLVRRSLPSLKTRINVGGRNKFFRLFLLFIIICLPQNRNYCAEFSLKINDWNTSKKLDLTSPTLKNFIPIKKKTKVYSVVLSTPSGIQVPIRFYDRNSDVVLIAGQPLPAPKEAMKVYADLFASYNVILFDYRWNNQYGSSLIKAITSGNPVEKILLQETEEIITVLNFVTSAKKYNKIVGLGECYSAFLFAKIQSDQAKQKGSGPFTHLILDSSWHSLKLLADRICSDPFLPIKPDTGGAPWLITSLTDNKLFKTIMLGLTFKILYDPTITEHLPALNIPVLFIHGTNDLFVPQEHFYKIWQETNNQNRAVLFTPYRHCDNLRNKHIYQYVSEQFVAAESTEKFENICADLF